MIELAIRNKWVSLRGSSVVKDLKDKDVLKVQGKFWTVTHKKFVQTLEGETKYIVRNKYWTLFTYRGFIIDPTSKEIVANIRRKVFSLHDRYFIKTKFGEIEIKGNILGFDYHIYLDGKEVGHVARKISLRDSYVLTINDENADIYFYVALVIAIDNITDKMSEDAAVATSSFN